MILPKEESALFFELYLSLLGYANGYDGKKKKRPLDAAREILYSNPRIVGDFLERNPKKFNQEKLDIVSGWQRFVRGDFIFIKSLKEYGALLTVGNDAAKIYGVVGLTNAVIDFAEYGVGTYFEKVALLPWKGRIIWDGMFYLKPLIIGRNYLRSFTEEYKRIKQTEGITESI